MYKISNGLPKPLMKDILPINRNPYNLRKNSQISRPQINTAYHGTKSISNLGPKKWNLVPSNLKQISDLGKFKKAIKQWKLEDCPCRACRVFVRNVGFLEKITSKKLPFKLLNCCLEFDISIFGNTQFCACVAFCAVKQCVDFVKCKR